MEAGRELSGTETPAWAYLHMLPGARGLQGIQAASSLYQGQQGPARVLSTEGSPGPGHRKGVGLLAGV